MMIELAHAVIQSIAGIAVSGLLIAMIYLSVKEKEAIKRERRKP